MTDADYETKEIDRAIDRADKAKTERREQEAERVRPFDCGSQYADWEIKNCDMCKKGFNEKTNKHQCVIQEAVGLAYWGDGKVSKAIADRMGLVNENPPRYGWRCPELKPTAAAKRYRPDIYGDKA